MKLDLPDPLFLVISLSLLALVPFIAVMATSFVKIAVVLGLVRNAMGIQQIPPNIALHGIALVLTMYIMAPVGYSAYQVLAEADFQEMDVKEFGDVLSEASGAFRDFLSKHASKNEKDFFVETAKRIWPEEIARDVTHDDLMVLIPAFTVSELKTAFEVGFLLYLPFIAIDLIISNILLAMGMMMVSPMTISLPFKLLLFVLLDGWTRLLHGLVLTY